MTAPDIAALAEQFGTPMYLYRLERAAAAWRDLTAALPDPSVLHYSLKANPHPDLVQKLTQLGAHAEISSPAELRVALEVGVPAHECLYTGPAKTEREIAFALANGVRRFSVESERDYHRVGRAAADADTQADCLIRVNGAPSGATGLRMTGAATQFGVELEYLESNPQRFAATNHTRVCGFHLFPVSNVRDQESLCEALAGSIRHARSASAALGIELEMVDLGGGFAAPYAEPGERPLYSGLRRDLEAILDDQLDGWRDERPLVAFESGRYLAGDCGSFVASVMDVKTSGSRSFVVLDGGINHLGGMAGLGRLLRPNAVPELHGSPTDKVTLVGPLCTPADVLSLAVDLPHVAPGDRLVFPNTGAYGVSASLVAFLSRPSPVEVALDGSSIVSVTQIDCIRSVRRSRNESGANIA